MYEGKVYCPSVFYYEHFKDQRMINVSFSVRPPKKILADRNKSQIKNLFFQRDSSSRKQQLLDEKQFNLNTKDIPGAQAGTMKPQILKNLEKKLHNGNDILQDYQGKLNSKKINSFKRSKNYCYLNPEIVFNPQKIQQPSTTKKKQEPFAINLEREPSTTKKKQEPFAINLKQEPSKIKQKQEPLTINQKQEALTSQLKQDNKKNIIRELISRKKQMRQRYSFSYQTQTDPQNDENQKQSKKLHSLQREFNSPKEINHCKELGTIKKKKCNNFNLDISQKEKRSIQQSRLRNEDWKKVAILIRKMNPNYLCSRHNPFSFIYL